MQISDIEKFQPPFPQHYAIPTVVQPGTGISNLTKYVLKNRQYIELLEENLCKFYNVKYCILVDRARTGAYLLLKAMHLNKGWITSSFMHRPFTALVYKNVSNLSFADVKNDFTINPKSVEQLINNESQVVFATHMYGKSANIVELRELANEYNLFLIENCVHMPGRVNVRNKPLGSWGDAALLSFNVDKPLSGLLGGAILTNREDVWSAVKNINLPSVKTSSVIKKLGSIYLGYYLKPKLLKFKKIRDRKINGVHEIEKFSLSTYESYNPKTMHSLQKAAVLNNLQKSDEWVRRRKENAARLSKQLISNNSLILQEDTKLQPNSFLYYPVIFKDHSRYNISTILSKMGIETKWRYFPLHLQKGFKECKYVSLDNTLSIWRKHLLFPIGHELKDKDVDYIGTSINTALKNSKF